MFKGYLLSLTRIFQSKICQNYKTIIIYARFINFFQRSERLRRGECGTWNVD